MKALARRHITRNVHGYTPYGARPAAERIIDDVESGLLDAAIVWGPQAGFFSRHSAVPLELTAIDEDVDGGLPLAFDISMAVRRGDTELLATLNRSIGRHRSEIDRILDQYGVPRRTQRRMT